MKKEQMVGTRLPHTMVRDLEAIEQVEQADRSTTVRKLLSRAIQDWKLDHYARLYGSGKLTLARAAREARVSLWDTSLSLGDDGLYENQENHGTI
jgi:hypothetical protein